MWIDTNMRVRGINALDGIFGPLLRIDDDGVNGYGG
jgi:hypothetical protein